MAKKKIEDLQRYWQEIAEKAGVSQDQIEAFGSALGNETVAKAFRQAFVPVPEFHSTLDEAKAEADARKAELDKWYEENARPAYETNLAGIERLRQYESLYGPLDPASTTRSDANALGFNSKAELDKYLDDRLKAERSGSIELIKVIPEMIYDFKERFGEKLNINEVEQLSVKKGLPPMMAYQEYIRPKLEAKQKEEFEAKIKEAEERGAKDAISKYHLPVESEQRESSPFFDRTDSVKDGKPMTEMEEDQRSRAGFMDGWNNYAETVANRNRS